MNKKTAWFTLSSTLVGVVMILILLWGALKLLEYNNGVDEEFKRKLSIQIIKLNSENILRKSNLSSYNDGDKIFIYKSSEEATLYVWDEQYRYTDNQGNSVLGASGSNLYERYCMIGSVVNGQRNFSCFVQ